MTVFSLLDILNLIWFEYEQIFTVMFSWDDVRMMILIRKGVVTWSDLHKFSFILMWITKCWPTLVLVCLSQSCLVSIPMLTLIYEDDDVYECHDEIHAWCVKDEFIFFLSFSWIFIASFQFTHLHSTFSESDDDDDFSVTSLHVILSHCQMCECVKRELSLSFPLYVLLCEERKSRFSLPVISPSSCAALMTKFLLIHFLCSCFLLWQSFLKVFSELLWVSRG